MVKTNGVIKPPAIVGHTMVKIGDEVLLYGGNTPAGENMLMYAFNLISKEWKIQKQQLKVFTSPEESPPVSEEVSPANTDMRMKVRLRYQNARKSTIR